MNMYERADVVIVGTGVAGLYCALNLPDTIKVVILTKDAPEMSDSYLAQGGICVLSEKGDFDSFFEDTLKAGHYENNRQSVKMMIEKSPEVITDLMRYGVIFDRENGALHYTKEGAHTNARILHYKDMTGAEITSKLLRQVMMRPNIQVMSHTAMVDLLVDDRGCNGVVIRRENGACSIIGAGETVLATGGIGGLYSDSTNYAHLTGDGIAVAVKHGIALQNLHYIQFHPTALYEDKPGRRFLISESLRGEGAHLLNEKKERFVSELLPRDVLTAKIREQMKREGSRHVWLSIVHLGRERIVSRFPGIYKHCMTMGIDITTDCIPVTPAQHYFMGGIAVDLKSRTSMPHLYAVGETACNGVHGANRLASNSLLESIVFAREASLDIGVKLTENRLTAFTARSTDVWETKWMAKINLAQYEDADSTAAANKNLVLNAIERNRQHGGKQIKCG
jgi:L-aspartate oxidase